MSDSDTREDVVLLLKKHCTLKTVLQEPCVYLGFSNTCDDCTFEWRALAQNVRVLIDKRRASYEKERENLKELKSFQRILVEQVERIDELASYGLEVLKIQNLVKKSGGINWLTNWW